SFLLSHGNYWIKVTSNYSNCVKVMAAFFDQMDPTPTNDQDATTHYLSGVAYNPPPIPTTNPASSPQLTAARELWDTLDHAYTKTDTAAWQSYARVLAY